MFVTVIISLFDASLFPARYFFRIEKRRKSQGANVGYRMDEKEVCSWHSINLMIVIAGE